MSSKNLIRIDYDGIDEAIGESFPLDPSKNYLTYMVHMEGISTDEEIKWDTINREIPVTGFELTNFKDQEDFKAYVKCYLDDFQSPIRPLNQNTAVACWGVFFIQEMDADTYFDFVNDLIEFDDYMGINTMTYENFCKFVQSDKTSHCDATFCVVGSTRPVILNIHTNS